MADAAAWYGPQISRRIAAAVAAGMAAGGSLAKVATRDVLNTPFPPASAPGQAPHRRTGGLLRANDASIRSLPGAIELRVGVPAGSPNAAVAGYLAGGTSRMAPRPWHDANKVGAVVIRAVEESVRSRLR